uniref:Putative nickel insertion protein n=1 Tax=Thermosporothrix sp. COM3 TaxID=2490863 RepID=A0A455SWN1_9CHLR|nr:TIGR00299 family protein [Thermosporothrix sp. COM3]
MTQRVAYLDCHSGISGDMFLGALLDVGLPFATLQAGLASVPFGGYILRHEPCSDRGVHGSRLHVQITDTDPPERSFSDIEALLLASALPERIKTMALALFRTFAEAEASVEAVPLEQVRFSDTGAIDIMVDVIGAAIGVVTLDIMRLYASPLPLTSGLHQTRDGMQPIPAPVTMELLRRVSAPWRSCSLDEELVTPTGAALLATLARFDHPVLSFERIGYGFGQKQLPWPNCLRLCLGSSPETANPVLDSDEVDVIETNIDNMSGELLGGLMERLFAAGALDVAYIPLQMKKNRPATLLTVLCAPEQSEKLALLLLSESATLGVRMQRMQRLKAWRAQERIDTPFGSMLVKVKRLGTRVISAVPEYEECARLARERDVPLEEIYMVARTIARKLII